MNPRDAEAIVRALWDDKMASQANTRSLDANSTSLDANTNMQRKAIEAMDALRKELHGPDKA
jgi:hypothetical protein